MNSRCLEGDSKSGCKVVPHGELLCGITKRGILQLCVIAKLNFFFFMFHINQLFHQWLDSPKALRLGRNVIFCSLCHMLMLSSSLLHVSPLFSFRTFCPIKPAKSLHTQKNRQFFFEPEDNFWIVMVT